MGSAHLRVLVGFAGAGAVAVVAGLVAHAQTLGPADWVESVWVAESQGLLRVRTSDGTLLSEDGNARDMRVVALDPVRGVVVGYGPQSRLRWISFDGSLLADVTVPVPANYGMTVAGVQILATDPAPDETTPLYRDFVALHVDGRDGHAFLGVGDQVIEYDLNGTLISQFTAAGGYITAIDVDEGQPLRSLWVATQSAVTRYASGGSANLALPLAATVLDADEDPSTSEVWVATSAGLFRFDGSTLAQTLSVPVTTVSHVALDGIGSAWAATDEFDGGSLLRIDSAGTIQYELAPFTSQERVVALVADEGTLSSWIAGQAILKEFLAASGAENRSIFLDSALRIRSLGVFADRSPALVAFDHPTSGQVETTGLPDIQISYSDTQTGPDPTTLVASVDGGSPSVTCTAGASAASCELAAYLADGSHSITATIRDFGGNIAVASVVFSVAGPASPPGAFDPEDVGFSYEDAVVTLEGAPGSVAPYDFVTLTNTRTGETVTTRAAADGSWSAQIAAWRLDEITVHASNREGSGPSLSFFVPSLDPTIAATAIDPSVPADMAASVRFLFEGPNRSQDGVAPGVIENRRLTVLRGIVKDGAGTALSGVEVRLKDRDECGFVLSRADGAWDMACNGGGQLVVRLTKPGYLTIDRHVERSAWRDYEWVGEARMLQTDSAYTDVLLSSTSSQAVHQATQQTDADGTRRATVIVPAGTVATMTLPDGSTQNLPAGRLRATEFTVGTAGLLSMPAPLPKLSHYTYALEMSFDEALALEATEVAFNQPVVLYVENFVSGGLPVGTDVPLGIYSRTKAQWEPVPDGRILAILSVGTDGLANLDLDGSGSLASSTDLAALNITNDERATLANLYGVGDSLSRLQFPHFSPGDPNYPFLVDGKVPDMKPPEEPDQDCNLPGSIIGCQSQRLGEALPLVGTRVSLVYNSTRVPGRKASVDIPLTGSSVPASLNRVLLSVDVAGKHYERSFSPSANKVHRFEWDLRDAYGRLVQGGATARVKIGHRFSSSYVSIRRLPGGSLASFGEAGVFLLGSARNGSDDPILWQEYDVHISGWDLSGHHHYNPNEQAVYYSDGSRRKAVGAELHRFAGQPRASDTLGDGGPALEAHLQIPLQLRVAADGSVFTTGYGNRIRRIRPDGIIETVAGTGTDGFSGDNGPALSAELSIPTSVAFGPDGSYVIADSGNNRIRRVDADGIITTVAGNGSSGFSGDGGPAISAAIGNNLNDVAVGPDGSIYIVQTSEHRIRRVRPDGVITTFAGGGSIPGAGIGDGGLATEAELLFPRGVFVSPSGRVFIADDQHNRIRAVDTSGVITTIAGSGSWGHAGDGGPATLALLADPVAIAQGADGSLFVAGNTHVRRIGPDGVITTIAGNSIPDGSCLGFGGGSVGSAMEVLWGIDVAPDGQIYVTDRDCHTIHRIGDSMPGHGSSDIVIPNEAGSELDVFSANGRHLRTLDTRTGAVRVEFGYDSAGRLSSVTDASGNELVIERNGTGAPSAIVAPGGQRTTLAVDANGFLSSVTNPAGEQYALTNSADGLLTGLRTPRLHDFSFTYDPYGRLQKDEDPVTGSTSLARVTADGEFTVTATSALGRVRSYRFESENGETTSSITMPDGTQTISTSELETNFRTDFPDGTEVHTFLEADPRFGMRGAFARETQVYPPNGGALIAERSRSALFSDPAAPGRLTGQIDELTINGNVWRTEFESPAVLLPNSTITTTSPEARQSVTTLDAQGRPVQVQIADLAPVAIQYDSRGRVESVTAGSGADARTSEFGYDTGNRLLSATDPLGRTVAFEYDLADRVIRQTRADGRQIAATYDASSNVATLTPPGRPAHGFSYTPIDLETRYSPPAVAGSGTTVTDYGYNVDRQLTLVTRPDAATVVPAYDATKGRLTSLTHAHETITPGYSATTGQITSLSVNTGASLAFSWDGFLPTNEALSGPVSGSVARTFDNDFRLLTESVNGSPVTFGRDDDGLLTRAGALALTRHAANGLLTQTSLGVVSTERGHNAFAEPTLFRATVSGAELYRVEYTRDKLGRIESRLETVGGITSNWVYGYDPAGRLATVAENAVLLRSYTYDANGNRLSKNEGLLQEVGTFDDQDRLLSLGPAIGSPTTTFAYTANGELSSKSDASGTTTFVYDALGNLRSATLPDGTSIEYVIDGRNRRVGRKVNGTLVQGFLYRDQLEPVAELDGAGNVVSRFVYGSKAHVPDYMVKGGTTYRIVSDHLGSPRLAINTATGAIAQRMDFDEWGNVTLDTAPGFQPFGFAGGLLDAHTGLTRFGARDYSAAEGRWRAKDPIRFASFSTNFYGYVDSDPINFIDPDGRAKGGKKRLTGNDPLLGPVSTDEEAARRAQEIADELEKDINPNRAKELRRRMKTLKDGRWKKGVKLKCSAGPSALLWLLGLQEDLDFFFDSPAFTPEEFLNESEKDFGKKGPLLFTPAGVLPNPAYDPNSPANMFDLQTRLDPRPHGLPARNRLVSRHARRKRQRGKPRRRYPRAAVQKLLWSNKLIEAVDLITVFLKAMPNHAEALSRKGHALELMSVSTLLSASTSQRRRWLEAAGACYRQVLKLRPADPFAHADLADYLDERGQFKRALVLYDRALDLVGTRRDRAAKEARMDILLRKLSVMRRVKIPGLEQVRTEYEALKRTVALRAD